MSVLISDLKTVPGIIGGLGLGIAAAQKELNADYIASLIAIVDMVKKLNLAADTDDRAKFLANLLMQLAPSRYQYTTTELQVRMDLSQTTNQAIAIGGGFAMGAIAISGSFARSTSEEYRAAAECHTIIDALLPTGDNKAIFESLLAAAKATDPGGATALPDKALQDQKILDLVTNLNKALAPKV
ncbi:MAG: hypothetical protein ABI693_02580 [Bryobacteraceae bacterium]